MPSERDFTQAGAVVIAATLKLDMTVIHASPPMSIAPQRRKKLLRNASPSVATPNNRLVQEIIASLASWLRKAGADGADESLGGQGVLFPCVLPAIKHRQDADEGNRIKHKRAAGTGGRNDQTAQRRPHGAGDVEPHTAERHGAGQILSRHQLR